MFDPLDKSGYAVVSLPEIDRDTLSPYFDLLPEDQYLKGGSRRRRFSWFAGNPQELIKLPHKLFYQTQKYEGRPDIFRQFDELDASLIREPAFGQMIDGFVRMTGIHMLNTPVEVHQIRIVSQVGIPGNPSPEGIHRDGCHYLGIFVIERHGIDGGGNSIHLNKDSPPVFQDVLAPGDMLLCNDEMVMHHAGAISRHDDKHRGYRDIFVLTAGEHRRK